MTPNQQLIQFLSDSSRPNGTLTYYELEGFLFAVSCNPDAVNPSEWLPMVFNGAEASYSDLAEAQEILKSLMDLYNEINSQVYQQHVKLPEDVLILNPAIDNVNSDAALSCWTRGFMHGHNWLINSWENYLPEELQQDLSGSLAIIGFFSSRQIADRVFEKLSKTSGRSEIEISENMLDMLQGSIVTYARIGRSIQISNSNELEIPEMESNKKSVGRNAFCPCGSGKKYKKCCLH